MVCTPMPPRVFHCGAADGEWSSSYERAGVSVAIPHTHRCSFVLRSILPRDDSRVADPTLSKMRQESDMTPLAANDGDIARTRAIAVDMGEDSRTNPLAPS